MTRAFASSRAFATGRGFRVDGQVGGGGGHAPPDPAPTITSGLTLVSSTTTSVTLTWGADQFVQSWLEYGLTTDYGSESDHETSFDYQTHQQTIDGLTPGTAYHFRPIVVNQDGLQTTGSDATFSTEEESETGLRPTITTLSNPTVPATSRPALGLANKITDPTWGTEILRLTNTHLRRNNYSKHGPWNADGTRIGLFYYSDWRLYDAATFEELGTIPTGVDFWQWSNTDASKMYGVQWNQGVRSRTSGSWSTIQALNTGLFAGYNYASFGNNEGNLSDTDQHMPVILNTQSNQSGNWRVVVFDPSSIAIRGYVDTGTNPIDTANVSKNGVYLSVQYANTGSGQFQGTHIYSVPGGNSACTPMSGGSYGANGLVMNAVSHSTWATDEFGNGRFVTLGSSGKVVNPATNVQTSLFTGTTTFNSGSGGHITANGCDYDGWVLCSTGVKTANNGHEQVVAIRIDGSGDVMVFAHAHACRVPSAASYDATPFAAPNRDLTQVIWGSAWDGSESSQIYAFVAGMSL